MAEAEVSLRFAIHLLRSGLANSDVQVAIDGAQVKTREVVHFDPRGFLAGQGWEHSSRGASDAWQGRYGERSGVGSITIHARPGLGDVTATLRNGQCLIAEAKKEPPERSKASAEYPLLREALGQLLTMEEVPNDAVLLVLVPHSPKFAELAGRWRRAPLVVRAGIGICTVGRDGSVQGWRPPG